MKTQQLDRLGLALMVISSVLLGIWATVNTIALRNTLLITGFVLSAIYLYAYVRHNHRSQHLRNMSHSTLVAWLPITLILAMLAWVVMHFIFFTQLPDRQLDELQSTWLRTLFATSLGMATGLAVLRARARMWLLWFGLFVSFWVLFYQYVFKAMARQSFFASDYYGDYIYWAKFSGVLAGLILIAGLLGLAIDRMRAQVSSPTDRITKLQRDLQTVALNAYIVVGILLGLYSFVFIFDAKNGVGVAAILFGFWFAVLVVWGIGQWRHQRQTVSAKRLASYIAIFLVLTAIFIWFGKLQIKNNPGWETLWEDIAISAQVDKHTHWHNPSVYGYPVRADGQSVRPNTYERVAWAVVGLQIIATDPVGTGIFRALPEQMRAKNIEFTSSAYTHSAWIDLGLAFGWPGLVLLPLALIITFCLGAFGRRHYFRGTLVSLSLTILVLYLVGEYAFQHGIEILFFVCAFLSALGLDAREHDEDRSLAPPRPQ